MHMIIIYVKTRTDIFLRLFPMYGVSMCVCVCVAAALFRFGLCGFNQNKMIFAVVLVLCVVSS